MQLQGPAEHRKETKKLKMALPKGINNMKSWVLAKSVPESILFLISLYNMYLFIEVIVLLMAHQITFMRCFIFTIYFSIHSFSSPALYYSRKRILTFKKCWKGSTTHPIAEWTFEVACQQIVDILQKQMNCDNPQLPQMWIQKYIWNSQYAWQSIL